MIAWILTFISLALSIGGIMCAGESSRISKVAMLICVPVGFSGLIVMCFYGLAKLVG